MYQGQPIFVVWHSKQPANFVHFNRDCLDPTQERKGKGKELYLSV